MKKIVPFLFSVLLFSNLISQIQPKHTFNMEVGMPVPISNKPFKGMMKGIVSVSPYYQYRLPNSLAFGIGANYHYLQINPFRVPPSEPVRGGVHTIGGFVKISHEKFHNEQFATDFGVKIGYSSTNFKTDFNDSISGKSQNVMAISVIPTMSFILSVDEFSSYRLTIGYAFQDYGFYPQRLGINSSNGFKPNDFNNSTSFLIVGFGFTHYFGNKTSN